MMMNRARSKQSGFISVLFYALTILTTGCTDDSQSSFLEEDAPIRFRCDSVDTRSAGYAQAGVNAIKTMGIYAAHTENKWTDSAPINFMVNQKVERTDASASWNYTPEVFWPGSGYTTFFAYAPHGAAVDVNGNSGIPSFTFDVAPTPAEQIDFLVSTPIKDLTKTSTQGYVNMMLRHALTRISFAARINTQSTSRLPAIQITNIALNGLYHKGTCLMDGSQRNWNLDTSSPNATTNYTLSQAAPDASTEGELKDHSLSKIYQDITTASGYLFLMPQQLLEAATIVIDYSIDNTAATPITLKLANALAGWQAGESIRYLIAIDYVGADEPIEISLTPSFTKWESVETGVTIDSDPFLDITDINVSAYDAAATRVYFYTNQPADSVYIDPDGIIAATGQSITIKNTFCNIAQGDVLSDNVSSNFHFNASTHQGYFDLINYDTGTTGSGANKGRQAVIIKLYAGKLVRHITVQPVITSEIARKDQIPYIGTFHRSNEIGERIVTWYADPEVEWTAQIINKEDHEELCIDRIASPDYQTNSLYSFSPRNPEGANVSSTERSVKGKGRVYFRVGWKSIAAPTAIRHALITVTYNNGESFDIYCRQGEEPEGLTSSNTTNPFSVYNLMEDGVHVDYPTQGGLLSQWGRPTPWPAIGDTGAPSKYPSTVDQTLSLDVNICPETYTYPDQATIDALRDNFGKLEKKWGYYADGYFDRRAISTHRVEYNSTNVASAGIMLFISANLHSVFIPTAGYRTEKGEIVEIGTGAGYWSKEDNPMFPKNAMAMYVNSTPATSIKGYSKTHAFYMRCIKILNPATLHFDANGGENAPRAISVNKGKAPVHIPEKIIPNDYRLDSYEFESWNTQKDGKGVTYLPGAYYPSDSENLNNDATLYAQWKKIEKNTVVDFSVLNVPTDKLLTGDDIYATYTGTGNNGEHISTKNDIPKEPVYHKIEISAVYPSMFGLDAYNTCKGKGTGWRLPRVSELYWMSLNSALHKELFSVSLWSGTNSTNDTAWGYYYIIPSYAEFSEMKFHTRESTFRCVKAVK